MAEAFAELGVTWFEEPVSSDDLDGLRLLRDRAPAGMDIAAGEYGYDLFYFRRMLEAGAVDVLQADATRCGGITGFLAGRRALRGARRCRSRPTAPVAARPPVLRRCRRSATSSTSTTTTASSTCSSTARLTPVDGALAPRPVAPGLGLEFKRRTPHATPSEPADASTRSREDRRHDDLTGHRDGDEPPSSGTATEVADPLFIDAAGPGGRAARRRSAARCGSTTAAGPCTPPTARTTARCRSASWSRATIEDVVATVAVCRAARRADPLARRRHQPRRPVLQRRRRDGLLQVPATSVLWIDPDGSWRGSQPGCVLDDLRDAGREARPDLRARPVDAQPLHARRHDRQQLVRRPLADRPRDRADLRPRRRAGHPDLRRHADARRRRRARTSWSGSSAAGGRRGEIYARLQGAPRPVRRPDPRAAIPKIPRRVSGYNLDELLPENGFHVARALVGTEGTCVTDPRGDAAPGPSPPARSLLVLGYPDVYRGRRPRHARSWQYEPIGLEGLDDVLVNDMKTKGIHPEDVTLLPAGRRLAAGRVRRRDQGGGRRQGPGADGAAQEARRTRRR